MHFITQLWSEAAIRAVCWTLVHSLWIGTLAAGLGGAVVMLTSKSSARLRYNLLGVCMVSFALVMAGLLAYEWSTEMQIGIKTDTFSGTLVWVNGLTLARMPIAGLEDRLVFFINQYSPVIFTVWLVSFLIKSLQFTAGLFFIQRVRTRRVQAAPPEWECKLLSLGRRLGVKPRVRLLQSELVKVPLTVGHFKPVILVPAGIFLQLSPGQIDTILLHELAHILRRDYLVNILQAMLETVFFFNPGLLWLSGLLREEREVCCDDIVLAQSPLKSTYLQALLAFQPYSSNRSESLELGLGGNALARRIKRIISQENQRLGAFEKIVLLGCLLAISAFCCKIKPEKTNVASSVARPDTSQAAGPTVLNSSATSIAHVVLPKAKKTHPTTTVPVADLAGTDTTQHFNSIRFIDNNHDIPNREMVVRDDRGNVYHLKFADHVLVKLRVNGEEIAEKELTRYDNLVAGIEKARLDAQAGKARAMKGRIPSQRYADMKTGKWGLPQTGKRNSRVKQMPPPTDISYDQTRVRGVIAALVRAGVVENASQVEWFGINENELLVNGKKQSASLHQELKERYDIRPKVGLFYGPIEMVGQGIILEKGDL
ncbi:M56 family metallopeptidase [Dyadobacter sp. 676]|uniref:M56 family metallopeptidase n=1 Tax=Dyadobacter sp. 676 TaxID=3088362 RepID=A0AAU8FJA1_9BACT